MNTIATVIEIKKEKSVLNFSINYLRMNTQAVGKLLVHQDCPRNHHKLFPRPDCCISQHDPHDYSFLLVI